MSMTTVKASLIAALVVALVAVPAWQQRRLQRVQARNASLHATKIELRTQGTELAALRAEAGRLRKVQDGHAELEQLRQWKAQTQPELLRLRGMAGVARQANVEAEQLRAQLARQASEFGTKAVSGAVADGAKWVLEQRAEGRLARLTASLHLTPDQVAAARDILLRQADAQAAAQAAAQRQQFFTGKYDKEELKKLEQEAGDPDTQIKALLTPDQTAAYPNYQQEENAHMARVMASGSLIPLQDAVELTTEQQNQAFAALYQVNFDQLSGKTKPTTTNEAEAALWFLDQQTKALESILTPTQLESYRQQQATQAQAIKDNSSNVEHSRGSK
jgi:hypothetical protein